jgi:Flp pilus assembly pilin Flp
MLSRIHTKNGQSIIEYAMIATVVTIALASMSTYVFRAVQATQQMIAEEARTQNKKH